MRSLRETLSKNGYGVAEERWLDDNGPNQRPNGRRLLVTIRADRDAAAAPSETELLVGLPSADAARRPAAAPPAVARADELTDALRSNKATRATGVADLHAALAAAHRPVKRAQPKKQRKLKYRGARLLNRYRERPI